MGNGGGFSRHRARPRRLRADCTNKSSSPPRDALGMLRVAALLSCLFLAAACGCGAVPSSPAPSASSGALSIVLRSLTTDTSGYRHATAAVTVSGPVVVNPTYCGHPAPVTLWAVDNQGHRLPDDTAYPLICQAPTTAAIPAGTQHTYVGQAGWPASAGPVTLHGELALAHGYLVLPTLNITGP
jgi:hypothetical protein